MFFEFADAEVARLEWEAGVMSLRFSAAALTSYSGGEVQWAPVLMRAVPSQKGVLEVQTLLKSGAWAGRLREGVWLPEGAGRQRVLRLPWTSAAVGTLELEWAHGLRIELPLQSLALQLPDDAQPVQAWQC